MDSRLRSAEIQRMSGSNIEPLARAICARMYDNPQAVERYWHVVAALIEAGLIDEAGNDVPHDVETGLAAYQDWLERHPPE